MATGVDFERLFRTEYPRLVALGVAMLNGGGLELEARSDIQRLQPTGYTTAEIAAALERWCSAGCDTAPPTLDELTFSGGFGLVRQGEEIRAGWFEGDHFSIGAPFRS